MITSGMKHVEEAGGRRRLTSERGMPLSQSVPRFIKSKYKVLIYGSPLYVPLDI